MADSEFDDHMTRLSSEIESTVEDYPTQPILFLGSGISRRYIDAPDWKGLLGDLADRCPEFDRDIGYYLQKGKDEAYVGSKLSSAYYDWAYGSGRDQFPEELFDQAEYSQDIFVKYEACEYFKDLTPNSIENIPQKHQREIELLREIQPHAIITTNYDRTLELIFENYSPIIGEEVIQSSFQNIGEVFKIHGCVSDPSSLVFTKEDYESFNKNKKYLAAKLLTYFTEHPVLFAGYGVGDDNVQRILADVDQVLSPEDGLVDNMFFLKFMKEKEMNETDIFESRKKFHTVEDNSVILNHIVSEDFEWVFDSFSKGGSLDVDPQLLRSIMDHTYDIVSTKAPREEAEINYQNLKGAAESEETLGTILGVSMMDDPPDLNIFYRYRTSDIAEELGYSHFNHIVQLIEQVEEEKGADIRDSDNRYHIDIAYNSDYSQHRYSEAALSLLRKVAEGEDYELELREYDHNIFEEATSAEAD